MTGRASVGGAANEAGAAYRSGVAAYFVAHGLNGLELVGCPIPRPSTIEAVALETDAPVDDLLVTFSSGRLFLQAKRSLNMGRSLRESLGQWLRAVRAEDFDPERDFLAVASATLSAKADALRRALDAGEGRAGVFVNDAQALRPAHNILRELGATEAESQLVLSRGWIVKLAVEEDIDADSRLCIALLDGRVMPRQKGHEGWRTLREIASYAARHRIGYDLRGWLGELRARGVPLLVDAALSRAAELEAQREALGAYRTDITDRGSTVDLTGLGAPIRNIPLTEMDAYVRVGDPSESDRTDRSLLWALRRRARIVLTGLPGGGKSVLLGATAAEWALRGEWGEPIWASLKSLVDRGDASEFRSLRDRILDLATAEYSGERRALVRAGLEHAIDGGNATFFLDGLDEAADRRLPLTREIAAMVDRLHPDCEVIVATRDSGYADAQALLEFEHLQVGPPSNADRAVRAVLTAIAELRGLADSEAWLEERFDWVKRARDNDRVIDETPLLPVVLTLVAADSGVDDLPETRAAILKRVVDDVVRRRESHRDEAALGLPAGHGADAILDAFPVIATCLARAGGATGRTELVDAVAAHLEGNWGLAPGAAKASARRIVLFWDEAGIFVAGGKDQTTSPRLQILLEIGAAIDAASRPEEADAFVAMALGDPTRRETLILAAGLSPEVSASFLTRVASEPTLELLLDVRRAHRQGATLVAPQLSLLAECLIGEIRSADPDSWRAAKAAIGLPTPAALRERLLERLLLFPAEHQAIGSALAALKWNWSGPPRIEALQRAIAIAELPRLETRDTPTASPVDAATAFIFWTTDDAYAEVTEVAARELLPDHPDLAPLLAARLGKVSTRSGDTLMALLRENGYGALADQGWEEMMSGVLGSMAAFSGIDEEFDDTITDIASLARPAVLEPSEQRQLPLLATFLEAIDFNHFGRWRRGGRLASRRAEWFRLVAQLCGLELVRLAAQAQQLQSEIVSDDYEPLFSLLGGESPEPTRWDLVDDPAAGASLAVFMLFAPRNTPWVAAQALAAHPDRRGTAASVAEILLRIPNDSAIPAVWAYLQLVDDPEAAASRLAESDAVGVRAAVARVWPLVDEQTVPTQLADCLAHDRERQVQLAVLHQLDGVSSPSPQLVELVTAIGAEPAREFTCFHCGQANEADANSCNECRIVTDKPNLKARALLERWQAS